MHGAAAYEKKEWKDVEHNMEESLVSYFQAEDECRAYCEGPFDQGWYPDFIPSIASKSHDFLPIQYLTQLLPDHFTMVLKCKLGCVEKLGNLNGEKHEDLLASHYHYLQYAYFKSK